MLILSAGQQRGTRLCEPPRQAALARNCPTNRSGPSIFGKARLKAGQLLCEDPGCPDYRQRGPVRDIIEWVCLRDAPFVMEPLEVDGETIMVAREYAVWDVVLGCGHFALEHTTAGWKPEDGFVGGKSKTQRLLQEVLDVIAKGDPDEEAFWRRRYTEGHPEPTPFTRCHTCACVAGSPPTSESVGSYPKRKTSPAETDAGAARDPGATPGQT